MKLRIVSLFNLENLVIGCADRIYRLSPFSNLTCVQNGCGGRGMRGCSDRDSPRHLKTRPRCRGVNRGRKSHPWKGCRGRCYLRVMNAQKEKKPIFEEKETRRSAVGNQWQKGEGPQPILRHPLLHMEVLELENGDILQAGHRKSSYLLADGYQRMGKRFWSWRTQRVSMWVRAGVRSAQPLSQILQSTTQAEFSRLP
jgi:hypothetical protein